MTFPSCLIPRYETVRRRTETVNEFELSLRVTAVVGIAVIFAVNFEASVRLMS